MTSNIKAVLDAIKTAGIAAKQAGKAAQAAQSAFQQIIGAIRATKLEGLFIVKDGNDFKPRDSRTLTEHEQKLMQAIRETCIAAYGWPKDKAAASFRHWKFRVANELSGKRIAEKSREARKAAKEKAMAAQKEKLAALINELQAALNAKKLATCKEHVQAALKLIEG